MNKTQFIDGTSAVSWEAPAFESRSPLDDAALFPAWRRLEAAAFLPTQSHAFAAALAHSFLKDQYIELFRGRGADGSEALLPLCRNKAFLSRWRLIGAREVFEPSDALYESVEAVQALAKRIARQARTLDLDRVPAASPLLSALAAAMKGRAWVSIRPALPFPTIALDERWKAPEDCFNSGRRSDFRRAARKAEGYGGVGFEVLSPEPGELDALFDEAIEVELRSWKKDAGTALAMDGNKAAFFREYFRACCERGEFRIAFMRIDGQAVAMHMAVVSGQRYWLFKIGYDEAFAKCSPGTLLMLHTLGWAAEQGLQAYELLGQAESWIADFWTRDQHECVRFRSYPYGIRGGMAFLSDTAFWLKQRLARKLARKTA